jgi:hypothetical protein
VSESGNLTHGIFLSLWRMSTVKIRAGSLLCTPRARIRAKNVGFRTEEAGFPHPSTGWGEPSQLVHSCKPVATCGIGKMGAKSIKNIS